MSERAPHPFPPVVRWAIFPALAALAGAAGGVASWVFTDPTAGLILPSVFLASLAAGCAAGAMLSTRRWVFLAGSPILGFLTLCTWFSLAGFPGIRAMSPWEVALLFLGESKACLLILGTAWLQGAAHTWSLHLRPAFRTLRSAGPYGIAALLAGLLALLFVKGREGAELALCFSLFTAFQAAAFLASLALARRLQPDILQRV